MIPVSHWEENGKQCFSSDALLEKLSSLDEKDIENIGLLINSETENPDKKEMLMLSSRLVLKLSKIIIRNTCMENVTEGSNSRREKLKGAQFVYIACCGTNHVYKIGRTKDLSRRERQLKTGNFCLSLFAYVATKNASKLERFIHSYYSPQRLSGEWFELNKKEIDDLIQAFGFTLAVEKGRY